MTCVVVVILILTAKAPRDEQDEHGPNGEDDGEPDGRRHLLSAQRAVEAFIARANPSARSVTARAVRGAVILAIMVVTAAAYHRMVIGADLCVAADVRAIQACRCAVERLDERLDAPLDAPRDGRHDGRDYGPH